MDEVWDGSESEVHPDYGLLSVTESEVEGNYEAVNYHRFDHDTVFAVNGHHPK